MMTLEPKIAEKYALIVGNGRSGSNWLVDIFDASPFTHCRLSPWLVSNSSYHQLLTPTELAQDDSAMAQKWEEFISSSRIRRGARDQMIETPKHHIHPIAQNLGISYHLMRPKVRKILSVMFPELVEDEWVMPDWMGDLEKLKQAYAIIKIDSPEISWITQWVVENRPQVPILHLIRHPGGFLNSGISRFFSQLDTAKTESEIRLYKGTLRTAVSLEPEWSSIIGDIEAMSLIESVMWFWRYSNEKIYLAGQGKPSYMRIVYENLAENILSQAKEIYAFCGLPWDKMTENRIIEGSKETRWEKLSGTSIDVSKAWEKKLTPEHKLLVEKVLAGSVMQDWWD